MNFDYIQIQTATRFFDFDERLFTSRKPTATGIPKRGLNVRQIVEKNSLPPCITDKVKLEVTANSYVTLGLPAALLGTEYFDLISEQNFNKCLQTLIDYRLVRGIDFDGLRAESKVVRLETTCDVIASNNPRAIDYYRFRAFLMNAYRWKRIEQEINSFGSSGSREQLKIYGKTREMKRKCHASFVTAYGIEIPTDLVRIEYRLSSAEKVRRYYGSKSLKDVLTAKKNVLATMLDGTFVEINPSVLYQAKDTKPFRRKLLFAEENAYDLNQIQSNAQKWGKHRSAKLRDIHQAMIATEKGMQQSGDILKQIIELQAEKFEIQKSL